MNKAKVNGNRKYKNEFNVAKVNVNVKNMNMNKANGSGSGKY